MASKESTHICVGSFTVMGNKPFKTYDEQIDILKSRGLLFDDEKAAKAFLEANSYYNVINGYKDAFITTPEERYLPDAKFEYIKALYLFDKRLRHSLLSILLEIETELKSIISYEFAKTHGECGYLEISNFRHDTDEELSMSAELISRFEQRICDWKNSKNISYQNIKHYASIHGEIPVWVLCSHLNLSDISKFYARMLPDDQQAICNHLVSINKHPFNTKFLHRGLWILSDIRNLCAHNQRLYTFQNTHHLQSRHNPYLLSLLSQYGKNFDYDNIISVAIVLYHLATKEQILHCLGGFIKETQDLLELPTEFTVALASQHKSIYNFIKIIAEMVKTVQ